MSGSEERNIAVALAELRGEVSTGFARLEERVIGYKAEVADTKLETGKLDRRVSNLENRRWPVAQMGVLSGVVGTVVSVASLVAFK